MMQENNNFDTIINTWRRMSGEQTEPVAVSMSGDSPDFQSHKKKDEETNLLITERLKGPIATAASAGTVATIAEIPTENHPAAEENTLKYENEECKDAAGDARKKDNDDYLEDKQPLSNASPKNEKSSDKVDSVFITPSSAIKPPLPTSRDSNPEDEDCGIKCLYYTLQCCDCVLM